MFGIAVLVLIDAGAVVISGIVANRPDFRAVSNLPEFAHFRFSTRLVLLFLSQPCEYSIPYDMYDKMDIQMYRESSLRMENYAKNSIDDLLNMC